MRFYNSYEINDYTFNKTLHNEFETDPFAIDLWPLVYILSNKFISEAYVGETTDLLSRMSTHLKTDNKSKLSLVHLITSNKFNKSATLDIESNLIKYIAADGIYKLQNANVGLANHTYFQNGKYWEIFKAIWNDLQYKGFVKHNLKQINNSDLFKYSPYKSLNFDQKNSIIEILNSLLNKRIKNVVVEGGAGTGKSILAIYLFKLLKTEASDFVFDQLKNEEHEFLKLLDKIKENYPNPRMALVIPMASFRNSIKNVFKNIKGLKSNMVIGPAEVTKGKYDLLIVDEAHRLRRRINLGNYFKTFDDCCKKLNLDPKIATELDWIRLQSKKSIFFYDEYQSIKPSDVRKPDFQKVISSSNTCRRRLKSQFRVKGGNGYEKFLDNLLNVKFGRLNTKYYSKKYEIKLFSSLITLVSAIRKKDREKGLCRIMAGYAWEWRSKKSDVYDIKIGNLKLKWNSVSKDWLNSKNAHKEVGCIHTTQGYDLNYAGVIFGKEISYDKVKNEIIILKENYHDRNGKQSIVDPEELKNYILNIYRTMLLRGIYGTYVYVEDDKLRRYFAKHMLQVRE